MNNSLKTFTDWLEKIMKPTREWIFKNYSNPILWLFLFIGGLVIFWAAYDALNKER